MSIKENYSKIQKEISETAVNAGRNPEDIKIISISKTFPIETIEEALNSGIILFGENKIQEAKIKVPHFNERGTFHMIGHLQSNKAKDAVKLFDLIHSLDKLSTIKKVSDEAEKIGKVQKILIQVNVSGEEQKSGISPDETVNFIEEAADNSNTEILGLMAMGPHTDDMNLIRESFKRAKKLLDEIREKLNPAYKELSMGMSSDYKTAVEEGATMIRIGSAIFGKRTYK